MILDTNALSAAADDDPGVIAQLARAGRCQGILLDTEQYEGKLFDYPNQRDSKRRTWDEYAAKAWPTLCVIDPEGDYAGIESAVTAGYFDQLGVRTIWLSPPNANPDGVAGTQGPGQREYTRAMLRNLVYAAVE